MIDIKIDSNDEEIWSDRCEFENTTTYEMIIILAALFCEVKDEDHFDRLIVAAKKLAVDATKEEEEEHK